MRSPKGALHNKVIRTWIIADTCTEWHVAPLLLQIGTCPVVALCIGLYTGISHKAVHRTTNWQRYETPWALDYNAEWTITLCSASSGLYTVMVTVMYLFTPLNYEFFGHMTLKRKILEHPFRCISKGHKFTCFVAKFGENRPSGSWRKYRLALVTKSCCAGLVRTLYFASTWPIVPKISDG